MLDRTFDQDMLLFTIPAIVGTGLFVIKMVAMTVGGFGGVEDLDTGGDLDLDGADSAGDSTDAFRLVSLQSIAALAMGFGTGGLVGRLGFEWSVGASAAVGLAFGIALVWILGLIMKAVFDLASDGNVGIRDAIGREGVVASLVPESGAGVGRVRIVIGERTRTWYAVSEGRSIASQTRVRVVRANNDNTLTVTAVG